MLDLSAIKKMRINLTDYQWEEDCNMRLLLASLDVIDVEVMEEILFSPLEVPLSELMETLEYSKEILENSIKKLSLSGLCSLAQDKLTIDKKVRRWFDLHSIRFHENFYPNLEFFQKMLHFLPMSVLPLWYNIPRTSNNIFLSILEKHIFTPSSLKKHLEDIATLSPHTEMIITKVFAAPDYSYPVALLSKELELSEKDLEELILFLEYSLILGKKFIQRDKTWEAILVPYCEYAEYYRFLDSTALKPIQDSSHVEVKRQGDFVFINDLSHLIRLVDNTPFSLNLNKETIPLGSAKTLAIKMAVFSPDEISDDRFIQSYISDLIAVGLGLRFFDSEKGKIQTLPIALQWNEQNTEDKAIYIYQSYPSSFMPTQLRNITTEKQLHEIEKFFNRLPSKGWVFFDAVVKSSAIAFDDSQITQLKAEGKKWHYALPHYSQEQLSLLKYVILHWFFICGITKVGLVNDKEVFCLTPFGLKLF